MNHSKQRDLIMTYLAGTKSHPTADEVYREVRQLQEGLSLGTVYRNLNQLADNGMIRRLHMQDGVDHFDADISEHYHLYCSECKRVYDLDMKLPLQISRLIKTADRNAAGSVEGCVITFYGKCRHCESVLKDSEAL